MYWHKYSTIVLRARPMACATCSMPCPWANRANAASFAAAGAPLAGGGAPRRRRRRPRDVARQAVLAAILADQRDQLRPRDPPTRCSPMPRTWRSVSRRVGRTIDNCCKTLSGRIMNGGDAALLRPPRAATGAAGRTTRDPPLATNARRIAFACRWPFFGRNSRTGNWPRSTAHDCSLSCNTGRSPSVRLSKALVQQLIDPALHFLLAVFLQQGVGAEPLMTGSGGSSRCRPPAARRRRGPRRIAARPGPRTRGSSGR